MFSYLQNEKQTLLKHFHTNKMQKHVIEELSSYLQNEKSMFLNCFSSLQHENHLFESLFNFKK